MTTEPKPAALDLTCPRCTALLSAADVPSLHILACMGCGGAWVDRAGCSALARDARPEVATRARELADGAKLDSATEASIHCPVCAKCMARHTLPASELTLDHCGEHGTWFDRGELRTLAFMADAERKLAMPGFARPGDDPSHQGFWEAVRNTAGIMDLAVTLASLFPSI